MKNIKYLWLLMFAVAVSSCEDYYKQPLTQDTTLSDVFADQETAYTMLNGAYYSLPHKHPNQTSDSGSIKRTGLFRHMAGVTLSDEGAIGRPTTGNTFLPQLNSVTADTWESQGMKCEDYSVGRYIYIRKALLYRDNASSIPDVDPTFLTQTKAEANLVIAILYFEMMKRYGAMPILYSATASDPNAGARPSMKTFVEYVDGLLADAIEGLPDYYESDDQGRVTRAAAYGYRSRLWLWAASPLFNKRDAADYAATANNNNGKTHEGYDFLNYDTSYDATLWDKAAQYTKEALDYCLGYGYKLVETEESVYKNMLVATLGMPNYNSILSTYSSPNTECLMFTRRVAYTNRNFEVANLPYGTPTGSGSVWDPVSQTASISSRGMGQAVSQNHVNMYRNADGSFPWSDDFQTITDAQRLHYAKNSDPWSELEPRFFANVLPDRYYVEGLKGTHQYLSNTLVYAAAVQWVYGYQLKRFLPDELFRVEAVANYDVDRIDVVMRLAELYLNYAECLWNQGNTSQAMEYLKPTMKRGGLPTDSMTFPTDAATAWDWIMRERAVELFAEEFRYFDCRRWLKGEWTAAERKGAMAILDYTTGDPAINAAIRETGYGYTYPDDYIADNPSLSGQLSADDPGYVILTGNEFTQYANYTFNPVQYLWPILNSEILKDCGWIQNPGYEIGE